MSHYLHRFLSATALCILMVICTSLSVFTVPAIAAPVDRAYPVNTAEKAFAAQGQVPAASLTNPENSTGINTDVIRGDNLVRSKGKYRFKVSSGKYLKSSWKTIGSNTYYFSKKGYALTGLQKIGHSYYIFSSKGVLKTGWIKYKNHWYYGSVNRKGRLLTGWQKIGGKRYYISVKKLYRLTGFQYIGRKTYYFNSKGVQQVTDQVVNGKKVVFNSDGSVRSYGSTSLQKTAPAAQKAPAAPAVSKNSANVSMGQQVVNFAVQYVGNPYKWGGSSLTKGADCSGFVMAVYAHFGIQLPHYDASIRRCGTEVKGGLANAKPGDVICYRGHVAIYMGNGRIVHAADYKYGICISKNAAYMKILSIRRFF